MTPDNQRIDGVVSGKEAVELTKKLWMEHRRFYRIIFMDCNMPEMDGYETT
jgi:CheY-like chemotaxis protein